MYIFFTPKWVFTVWSLIKMRQLWRTGRSVIASFRVLHIKDNRGVGGFHKRVRSGGRPQGPPHGVHGSYKRDRRADDGSTARRMIMDTFRRVTIHTKPSRNAGDLGFETLASKFERQGHRPPN